MSQAEELIGRLASCLCEGEEVDLEILRSELVARLIPLFTNPLEGPGATLQQAFEAAGTGHAALMTWAGEAPRLAWAFAQEGVGTRVVAALGWPYGRVLGDALCFECAMLAATGVTEVCLASNAAALAEGEFDEAMDPILSVIRTAHEDDADADACGCDDDCCVHDHGANGSADDACAGGGSHGDGAGFVEGACDCDCDAGAAEETCACGHGDEAGAGTDDTCACGHDHDDDSDDDWCDVELTVSVAVECGQLTPQQLCQACDAVSSAGPDYVIACTGQGPRCATPEDVRLISATVEPGVDVRATTDARTLEEALGLFEAGAVELFCLHPGQLLLDFDRLAANLDQ